MSESAARVEPAPPITGELIYLNRHKWAHCDDRECRGCMLCHGGLGICDICGAGEGALPTDCPGYELTWDECEIVFRGYADWIRGVGWMMTMPERRF